MGFVIRRLTMLSAALLVMAAQASAFETKARAAFVLDHATGAVLLAKRADEPMPPASMSKLMTLYLAFEAVRDGRLSLDERLPVSSHAMSYGGSSMFLNDRDRVKVSDLLRGIIVLSGNDACAVIAEALSPDGTEAGFAEAMTQRAQQLGMTSSRFRNASGWPAAGHVMSMRDLVLLGNRLITDFPEFYPMFAERRFEFDGRTPANVSNRNPLLGLGIGADGLKTGHTREAGYGLVGSAHNGSRRVIFAITGLQSAADRARESEAIVNWAFRQFAQKTVVRQGAPLASVPIWMGEEKAVDLIAPQDLKLLLPIRPASNLSAEVVYHGPIEAPVRQGDKLGELIIRPEGMEETRLPLVAARDVAPAGFMQRMLTNSAVLIKRLQASRAGDAM